MMYAVGDTVADHQFLLPSGKVVRLSELASGPVILIFYRHLM